MRLWHVLTAAFLLILLPLHLAHAGAILLPGVLDEGSFTAAKDASGPYPVSYAAISVDASGPIAQIKLQETVAGPESPTPVLWLLPLPAGSEAKTAYTLTVTPAGSDKAQPVTVNFLPAAEAQKLFESIATGSGSPAILAYTGRSALVAQLTLKDKTDFALTYGSAVKDLQGMSVLAAPMPSTRFTRGPIDRLSLSVTIKSDRPLRTVFSPTHAVTIERKGLTEATATLKAERYTGTDDFRLCFVADTDDLGLRLLTYRDAGDPDGYFMLVGNPTGSVTQPAVDKDVIFVLDTSGSMRGDKIEQCRAAIDYCLTHLHPGDRFNIVTFGTDVLTFKSDLTTTTPASIAAAREFVDNVVAQGRTNIGGALAKAFAGASDPARPRIMIFLTDGTPTAGELKPEKILAAVPAQNVSKTRVFVVGVGNDVNAHLLDKLAEDTDGASEYIAPNEEIDVKVAALYDQLSNPVLTGVTLDFGDLQSFSVYPKKLPALFKNSEIMVVGQYHDGGVHTASITGTLVGKQITYTAKADFPAAPTSSETSFVAPLWAARKIGFLLTEIRLHPGKPEGNKELIEEVVRLSRKFGIVTEYTDFIVAAPDMDSKALAEVAKDRLEKGRAEQMGQGAVNKSKNEMEMQGRLVVSPAANVYRDRRGQMVTTETIKQAGTRTYYLRNGQWADGEELGNRKMRNVKYMSPEYLKLVRENPDFAKSQELGWAISVNVGEERIVVERDGKTADEELKKVPTPALNNAGPPANGPPIDQQLNGIPQNQPNNIKDR